MSLAPCIAVVGPANAGKTTILNQIDQRLKPLLDSFLVLKGQPDGNGLYMYYAPELRKQADFKASVKGEWIGATVERICEWVTHGRQNLSLALLDFGGRNDAITAKGNERMLDVCSHYLVVSRANDPGRISGMKCAEAGTWSRSGACAPCPMTARHRASALSGWTSIRVTR